MRYFGIFSAHHNQRGELKALLPQPKGTVAGKKAPGDAVPAAPDDREPMPPQYRQPWSVLLKRVFGHEMLVCPKCSGKMRLIAMINSREAIDKILTHLRLETALPQLAPARDPPQLDFDDLVEDGFDIDEAA